MDYFESKFMGMLKNIFVYYSAILLPFAAIIYLAKTGSPTFIAALLLYAFLYRPMIDRYRLLAKGVITPVTFWKFYLPSIQVKYFKELYLP